MWCPSPLSLPTVAFAACQPAGSFPRAARQQLDPHPAYYTNAQASVGAGGPGVPDGGELLKIWELYSKEISFDKTEDEDGFTIKVRGIASHLHKGTVHGCSL